MNIPKIKMLILDVDGTMTDNGIYIDENGLSQKGTMQRMVWVYMN